jgi:hypothetical protein
MAGSLRRKQVLDEISTDILCDGNEIDMSDEDRLIDKDYAQL